MKSFKDHSNVELNEQICAIYEFMLFLESDIDKFGDLNEIKIIDKQIKKLNPFLSKIGMKVVHRKTLNQHLMQAGVGVAKMIYYAAKGDKEAVLKLMKSVKREDVAGFVLMLDKATLNIIGGTLGRITAITGWKLRDNAGGIPKIDSVKNIIKKAFASIRDHLPKLGSYQKGDRKKVKALEKVIV